MSFWLLAMTGAARQRLGNRACGWPPPSNRRGCFPIRGPPKVSVGDKISGRRLALGIHATGRATGTLSTNDFPSTINPQPFIPPSHGGHHQEYRKTPSNFVLEEVNFTRQGSGGDRLPQHHRAVGEWNSAWLKGVRRRGREAGGLLGNC